MKVSFTGAPEFMDRNVGYGEASFHIFEEFKKQGVECLIGSPAAKIGISFVQPDQYKFGRHQYKIGYTPWESTGIFERWKNPLLNGIDELWTTSPWCGEMFKAHTNKPIFVYEHGIEESWIPRKRVLEEDKPFRFLHIGEPAFRKDAQMVIDAFIDLYGNNSKYELILKCSNLNMTSVVDPLTGKIKGSPGAFYSNIKIIESFLSNEQMNDLYDLSDAFIYPSWGEGFGFNPLQAMAKGLPTVCTKEWASYSRYITAPLNSELVQTPWPTVHPGFMYKPNYEELFFYMKNLPKNYDMYAKIAFTNSFKIHKDYSWERVTKPAVKRLEEISKNL